MTTQSSSSEKGPFVAFLPVLFAESVLGITDIEDDDMMKEFKTVSGFVEKKSGNTLSEYLLEYLRMNQNVQNTLALKEPEQFGALISNFLIAFGQGVKSDCTILIISAHGIDEDLAEEMNALSEMCSIPLGKGILTDTTVPPTKPRVPLTAGDLPLMQRGALDLCSVVELWQSCRTNAQESGGKLKIILDSCYSGTWISQLAEAAKLAPDAEISLQCCCDKDSVAYVNYFLPAFIYLQSHSELVDKWSALPEEEKKKYSEKEMQHPKYIKHPATPMNVHSTAEEGKTAPVGVPVAQQASESTTSIGSSFTTAAPPCFEEDGLWWIDNSGGFLHFVVEQMNVQVSEGTKALRKKESKKQRQENSPMPAPFVAALNDLNNCKFMGVFVGSSTCGSSGEPQTDYFCRLYHGGTYFTLHMHVKKEITISKSQESEGHDVVESYQINGPTVRTVDVTTINGQWLEEKLYVADKWINNLESWLPKVQAETPVRKQIIMSVEACVLRTWIYIMNRMLDNRKSLWWSDAVNNEEFKKVIEAANQERARNTEILKQRALEQKQREFLEEKRKIEAEKAAAKAAAKAAEHK